MADDRSQARTASAINIAAGIWLILAPFILGYTEIVQALWNDIIVGVIVAVIAALRVFTPVRSNWLSWVNVILGFWLIVAPFILGYPIATPRWNDIILGIIIIVLNVWSATSARSQA